MSTIRKPRSDSKLDGLDLDQQRQLCEWLLSGLSYEKVKQLVLDEFNVSTTAGSLSSFYQSYVSAYLIQRRSQAVGVANEISDELKKTPGEFQAVTIDALAQKAFELANNPLVNPKDVKAVFTLLLKARDQELKQSDIAIKLRRLELLEKNAESAKAKLTDAIEKAGTSISQETLKTLEQAAKLL